MGVKLKKVFVVLVSVKAKQIGVIAWQRLREMIAIRENAAKEAEAQYVVLVTARKNSKLRVYLNVPGKKGLLLKKTETKVARDDFLVFCLRDELAPARSGEVSSIE